MTGPESSERRRVRVVITGYVQGVAFRANCQREASRLNLTGWVRNRWDGAVEAVFEGPAPAVEKMIRWCQHGPSRAHVEGIEIAEESPGPPEAGFRVR